MASRIRVKVNVLHGAVEAFVRTDPKIQAEVDRRAEAMMRVQLSAVPVDTGNLHDHIGIRKTADGGREVGVFDKIPLIPADYVLDVEFGHTARNGRQVPAQPFIRPSIDAAR